MRGETAAFDITGGSSAGAGTRCRRGQSSRRTRFASPGGSGDRRRSPPTAIKVSRRFLGWANFIFDPSSPYFGKSAGEVVRLDRLRRPDRSGAVQPGAGLRQHLEQCRLAAWRRVDQALSNHRHGLRRHAARGPRRLPAGVPGRPQYHRSRLDQPDRQALLRLSALGRHADLGALLHPRLRAGPPLRHSRDILHRHRHARETLFRSPREYRGRPARGGQIGRRRAGARSSVSGSCPRSFRSSPARRSTSGNRTRARRPSSARSAPAASA